MYLEVFAVYNAQLARNDMQKKALEAMSDLAFESANAARFGALGACEGSTEWPGESMSMLGGSSSSSFELYLWYYC